MNSRKVKRKNSKWIGLFVLLAILSMILIAGVLLLSNSEREQPEEPLENLDSRAKNIGIFESLLSQKNTKDEFSYEINSRIDFLTWDQEGDISLKNPSENHYLMALEIVLEENNQVVFRSGYIKPGQQIRKAPLDVQLTQGTYRAAAHIWAIDAVSLELLDLFEEPLEINIKE